MKNIKILLLMLFIVTGLHPFANAYAQCGAGIPSGGNPNCIPPSVYHSQGITQPQMSVPAQQPVIIRQKWADRWGAISADGVVGSLGFVTGYSSKKMAENAAVRECIKGGGRECRPEYAFRNGCAAFVVGDKGTSITSAKNEVIAAEDALNNCKSEFGNCRVYKTACSHAEAVPIR